MGATLGQLQRRGSIQEALSMASIVKIRRPELYEEVPCSNCGKIFERRHMKEYRPGRTTFLICPEIGRAHV